MRSCLLLFLWLLLVSLTGSIDVSTKRPYAEVKKGFTPFQSGDVLFAKITPCMENGKMAVVPKLENRYGYGSTEFHVIRPKDSIESKYVYYYVSRQDFRKEAAYHMTGAVGQKRVPTDFLKQSTIPLPPTFADQQRIVAEIEKQLSRLDEAVASLKRIQANLKRYKASVLKAAVEGKLTEGWRKNNVAACCTVGAGFKPAPTTVEPADKHIKRILTERRAKWETEELAKMKAKGIKPKDDSWKKKYKEPAGPDTDNLPELPEGWVWATLDAVLVDIQAGKSFKCDEREPENGEVGVAKVNAVSWGEYDESKSKTCIDIGFDNHDFYIHSGDFLFSRANTIELVGACVIAKNVSKNIMLSDKILRFRLIDGMEHWVLFSLCSRFGRPEIERLATGNQESMRNIGQDRIRVIRIALPSSKERFAVLEEIDRRLSVTEEFEATIETNLKRAGRLRQTILQRAFSGQL